MEPINQIPATFPAPYCTFSSESDYDTINKLFLGGIPSQTTEKELETFFAVFGKIKDVRIVTDRVTAECKGYGFVTFTEDEDIEHLVDRKTIRMNGKKLRIRKAIRRNGSQFESISPKKSPSTKEPIYLLKEAAPSTPLVIPSSPCYQKPTGSPPQFYQPMTPPPSPEAYSPPHIMYSTPPDLQMYCPSAPTCGSCHNTFQPQPLYYVQQPSTYIPNHTWPLYQM